MRGSIRQRSPGLWQIRWSETDPTTGRRIQRSRNVSGKKADAERALRDVLAAKDAGTYVEPAKLTVREFLERWLRDYLLPSGRAEWTRRTYESILRTHVIPALGAIPLQKLTPAALQRYYAEKRQGGAIGNAWTMPGKPLSTTTVAHHHAVIHEALEHAVKWGLVARNVAEAVNPPKIKRQEMKTWTPEDVQRFLAAARDDRFYALFLAAITTGMRQGELLGLRWQDVDLAAGVATVQQTLHKAGREPVFGRPKTERSRRRVVLLPELVAALRAHKAAQNEERLLLGTAYRDYGLVFAGEGGAALSASNLLKRHFRPVIERAGVPPLRFHDLRHTHASLLLADGVHPKVVSERLGHASVSTTLDVYSHVLPDLQKDAVAGLQRRLFAAEAPR